MGTGGRALGDHKDASQEAPKIGDDWEGREELHPEGKQVPRLEAGALEGPGSHGLGQPGQKQTHIGNVQGMLGPVTHPGGQGSPVPDTLLLEHRISMHGSPVGPSS